MVCYTEGKKSIETLIINIHTFAYISSVFGMEFKKKGWGDLRKLISHFICKAFWDTTTPGASCLCTINNFWVCVGFLWAKRRYVKVCLPKMGATNKRCEMDKRERGRAGFIYNGWLAENETWLFFISPVVVKEVPVTMRAMLPGQWMFPWQLGDFYPLFWLMLSCCLG